jgi:RimJ/RimL family protein N-acetyltransferase
MRVLGIVRVNGDELVMMAMSKHPPRFEFRPLTREDLAMLHEWLNRPHVARWWPDAGDLEEVSAFITRYVAYLDGESVGFLQVYRVMGADPDWWKDETDPGARGVDQFLAHAAQLGQGLGTEMVRQFLELLFRDPEVTKIQADPAPDNGRAIRAYEKAGFRAQGVVNTPDGPALLMSINRGDRK